MPLAIFTQDRHIKLYNTIHKTYKHYDYSFTITLFKHLRNSSIFKGIYSLSQKHL